MIVCPNCRTPKGIKLDVKSTRCNNCGKTLKIDKVRILHKTSSQDELRNVIGLINAGFDGREEDFKKFLEEQ
ncbi:MAG: DUF1922 domain-containing protein [Candidatus Thermoplasmatota archaeon]